MDTSFTVTVTDISKQEFLFAVRWVSRLRDLCCLIFAPIAFLILICFMKGFSAAAVILPVLLLLAIAVSFELSRANDYQQFPKDLKIVYQFDPQGWHIQVGSNTGSSTWAETAGLVERKQMFLLCKSRQISNLLPHRCLTEEQAAQIRDWYRASR